MISNRIKQDLSRALALLRQGDWRAAHLIVQCDEDSALSCWAHGIVQIAALGKTLEV